ncbi:uncharacterized protein LOC121416630 [Lytechinus variegatus]|uniref:uncharacterized protein LOC121416630 n=1 Tax=Lytechinus variegatus TaxID=7654 RepID=UPI001BB14748|nr:uncharacterized protein LOC121416630 [Lytechinus variegatus]
MTNLSPALVETGSLPCISAGVGEGIVIIILMVVVIALSLHILQLRKTMNDSNCAQQTQPRDAGQSSMSTDKDTGSNHGFEDVKEAGSSQSPDGEVQDSSKIYEQNHDSALDPNNSIQLQHSCTMSKSCSRIYV